MTELPKVTFGIIVLNGEPYVRHCLRALYPFAHQIIVVEGAAPGAAGVATPEGHSLDGTLETLRQFASAEDPDSKLTIVTRDGFWVEKDQMSQEYAKRATGDYLWQVDIDEFYKAPDMERVLSMLRDDPSISAVSFHQIMFWGSFNTIVDGWYLRRGAEAFHRLFKWGPGYTYKTHRPPTVLDPRGRDTRKGNWLTARSLARQGIYMYHYAFVFPKQVIEKSEYYGHSSWSSLIDAPDWARDVYLALKRPFRVHNVYQHPSWLERYEGTHPAEIQALQFAVASGMVQVQLRRTDDIDRLLSSKSYAAGRTALKVIGEVDRRINSERMVWLRLLPVRAIRKLFRLIKR